MKDQVKVSYSSITKFKRCPKLFFLSKLYRERYKSSALLFGKAFEDGIVSIIRGEGLDAAKTILASHWGVYPANEYDAETPILDNPEVRYLNSDLDINYVRTQSEQAQEWFNDIMLPEADGIEWAALLADLIQANKEGSAMTDKERLFFNRMCWLSVLVRGHVMLEAFDEQIYPNIEEVIDLQRKVGLESNTGDIKTGYVDAILRYRGYNKPIIFDFKTAGQEYSDHQLDTSEQLLGYSVALESELNSNLIGYIVCLKKLTTIRSCDKCGHLRESGLAKKCKETGCTGGYNAINLKGETQVLIKEAGDFELNGILDDDSKVITAIRAGIDFKNPNACLDYGRRCEFYDHCHKGVNLDELEELEPIKERK